MMRVRVKKKGFELVAKVKVPLKYAINKNQYEVLERNIHMGYFKLQNINGHKLELKGPIGINLYKRMKAPISQYDFFYIIGQFVDFIQKIEKLGLSWANLVLDLKSIFLNEVTRELSMIYLPIVRSDDMVDMMAFLNQMVYSAKPEEGADYISSFNCFLKNLGEFDAEKIEAYIYRLDRSIVNSIKKAESENLANTIGMAFVTKPNDDDLTDMADDDKTDLSEDDDTDMSFNNLYKCEIKGVKKTNDGDEESTSLLDNDATILFEEEVTELYEGEQVLSKCPVLIRVLTEEIIKIDKPVFRLGKGAGSVDYVIKDNVVVSRSHADIICRDGRYYVRDLRSKNKTYINNRVLPIEHEVEIFSGDVLKLANEEFLFQI